MLVCEGSRFHDRILVEGVNKLKRSLRFDDLRLVLWHLWIPFSIELKVVAGVEWFWYVVDLVVVEEAVVRLHNHFERIEFVVIEV